MYYVILQSNIDITILYYIINNFLFIFFFQSNNVFLRIEY